MLPFLAPKKKQQISGIATEYRKPDSESDEADNNGVEVAMREFCDAKERNDYKGMAAAFKSAFQILESSPHEEADHSDQE